MAGRIAGVLVGILLGVMASPAMAQSLGDVAREEAARRQQVKQTGKVLTNADLPASAVVGPPAPAGAEAAAEKSGDAAAPAGETAAAGKAEPGEAGKPAAKDGASKAAPTDDEDGWRARAEKVNAAVAAANAQVRQLKALSDRLSLEAQASNPKIATAAQAERTDLRAQITQAEEKQALAQAEREALVQQARVAGVPPAWIQ